MTVRMSSQPNMFNKMIYKYKLLLHQLIKSVQLIIWSQAYIILLSIFYKFDCSDRHPPPTQYTIMLPILVSRLGDYRDERDRPIYLSYGSFRFAIF